MKFYVTLTCDIDPDDWRKVSEFDGADDEVPNDVRRYIFELVATDRYRMASARAGIRIRGLRGAEITKEQYD